MLVVSMFGPSGGVTVGRAIADAGLQTALRLYGHHLDEVVLIVSDDLAVGWSHG